MMHTPRTRLLLVLACVFVTSLVVGDLIGGKLISGSVWGMAFTLSVGMVPFPLTFLLTDVINEFYGQQTARFVSYVGLGMAVLAMAFISIAIALPISPLARQAHWSGVTEGAFNNVLGGSRRILIASMVAYLAAQLVDIALFHVIKRATGPRFFWMRSTGSTVVAQWVDTVCIQTVAWWGLLPLSQIVPIALTSYAMKVLIALSLTPALYAIHKGVERWLGITPLPSTEHVSVD